MNGVEGIPLKMAIGAPQEEVELITPPDITVPDYLTILRDTEYEFSLERWVLTSLQGGYPSHPRSRALCTLSERPPSCPPYWQMFSSPQQSRLASRHRSDFWEPNPRQRSRSLNPKDMRAKLKLAVSDSEDEGDGALKRTKEKARKSPQKSPLIRQGSTRTPPRPFTPDLLNPPACLSSLPHQRRKNLRQSSCSVLPTPAGSERQSNVSPTPTTGPPRQSRTPQRPLNARANTANRPPNTRANTININHNRVSNSRNHKPAPLAHSQSISLPVDSSLELLSALSQEERELLEAITEQGYPLRTAILALQKTGQQSPEKILNYLLSCDHLCGLGYDKAQVEEALEMFQNCETKAEEFLHLLKQFNEMGFQQNTIKEVLLVHENHRERALEELMARVA